MIRPRGPCPRAAFRNHLFETKSWASCCSIVRTKLANMSIQKVDCCTCQRPQNVRAALRFARCSRLLGMAFADKAHRGAQYRKSKRIYSPSSSVISSKYASHSEGATRHRRTVCRAAHGEQSDDNVNPYTGNPQTGKLIDEYLWMGALLAVILLGFVSLYTAQDVLRQTSRADQTRAPADKAEWLAMDNSNVRFFSSCCSP